MPTMWVAASMSPSVSGAEGGKARARPPRKCCRTVSRDSSEWMTASLEWRSCSRAISRTISSIQASPASDPEVPEEPTTSGIPALTARVIMISVSRLTAARENMQAPVASGPGPGSVLPASQPIILAPSPTALSSESARNPEPSMPVADTSGNDAIAIFLARYRGRISPAARLRNPGRGMGLLGNSYHL